MMIYKKWCRDKVIDLYISVTFILANLYIMIYTQLIEVINLNIIYIL